MKKQKLEDLLSLLAAPVMLCLAGLILLFRPDSAAALVARVLGWGIFLVGAGFGIAAVFRPEGTAGKILTAIVCLGFGGWLIRHPLAPASFIGRFLGVLLVVRGIQDFSRNSRKLWSIVTVVLGVMLVLMPMTASHMAFALCGLVMLLAGAAMLFSRLRNKRLDAGSDDPNIIDAL